MDFLRILQWFTGGRNGFVFELLICEIFYTIPAKPRKYPYLCIPAALAAYLLFGILVPYFNRVTLVIFAFSILLQWLIWKLPFNRVLFNSTAAYATQNLAVNLCSCLTSLGKLTPWGRMGIKLSVTLAVYLICYFVFARTGHKQELHIRYIYLYVICFLTVVITNILFWYVPKSAVAQLALAICCIVALMLQYSAFVQGVRNHERVILEQLLYAEQKQHALSEETIQIINIKCHDLKKQIALLKQQFGDNASDVIAEAERAVSIYDNSVDTGNKNLDLVINEEKLFCERHDILLDIMADGKLVDFMAPSDIYSLFGNALKNAVENVEAEEKGNRRIALRIHKAEQYVAIEITNYCSRPVRFENGLPLTRKHDARFHGYGIRSMEYIVEKYGGHMVIDFSDNIFLVKIIIKLPS